MNAGGRIRVQSVPAEHPYVVEALPDPDLDPVTLLRDPVVDPADLGRWWPPPALDPAWLERHIEGVDVLHVHFGFDTSEPADLAAVATIARRHGTALVVTVHDLHNPHQPDPGPHLARLTTLVGAADGLITLTEGAADEVRDRWNRRPVVLPHPHLAAGRRRRSRTDSPAPRVGVHLKDLRPNTDTATALDAVDLLTRAGDGTVTCEVRVHDAVLDPAHPRHDPALPARLEALGTREQVEVIVHDRLSDADLEDALAALDVSVLPYRFGTHSGWLQLCRDLGVLVAAPDVGHYRDQVEASALATFSPGSPDSVVSAVRVLLDRPAPPTTTPDVRERRRAELRDGHLAVYRSALAGVRG